MISCMWRDNREKYFPSVLMPISGEPGLADSFRFLHLVVFETSFGVGEWRGFLWAGIPSCYSMAVSEH